MAKYHMETLQKEKYICKKQVELFLDEEERSIEDERSFGESTTEEDKEPKSDGNNTPTQKKFGLDINMIGARQETLGKTRSETKEMSSPRNESMERADLTMEDWIQETCLISAVNQDQQNQRPFRKHGTILLRVIEKIGELPLGRKSEA